MFIICSMLMISISIIGVWNFGDIVLISTSMLLIAPFKMLAYTVITLLVSSSVNVHAKMRKLGDFTYPFVPVIAVAFPIACFLG